MRRRIAIAAVTVALLAALGAAASSPLSFVDAVTGATKTVRQAAAASREAPSAYTLVMNGESARLAEAAARLAIVRAASGGNAASAVGGNAASESSANAAASASAAANAAGAATAVAAPAVVAPVAAASASAAAGSFAFSGAAIRLAVIDGDAYAERFAKTLAERIAEYGADVKVRACSETMFASRAYCGKFDLLLLSGAGAAPETPANCEAVDIAAPGA
ncbi:MAG: hypothetical protein LBL83_06055 [Clostridiales bacterium]|jgi:hypothetical protein|nr:hypothetical protein [Clostridiales bacterium]